jgi:hypothetical protein
VTGAGLQSVYASARGGVPGLWIDCLDYGRRLFLGGDEPWADPARFVSDFTQAQQLLKSDLIDVRAEDYAASWLKRDGAGLEPARRPTSDLKQILGDDGLRAGLLAVLATLGDLGRGCAGLALTLPSPRRWLRLCVERAGGDTGEPLDEDHVEMAAMYVADFLRAFAECGLSALLLEEDGDPGSNALSLYQPVLNVAAGYQWGAGLLIPGSFETGPDAGVEACFVDPQAFSGLAEGGPARGVSVPAEYWGGKGEGFDFPPGCEAAYVRLPADANPEQVLERLKALRGGA